MLRIRLSGSTILVSMVEALVGNSERKLDHALYNNEAFEI